MSVGRALVGLLVVLAVCLMVTKVFGLTGWTAIAVNFAIGWIGYDLWRAAFA